MGNRWDPLTSIVSYTYMALVNIRDFFQEKKCQLQTFEQYRVHITNFTTYQLWLIQS